ncbi:Predicted dehydrogenase [Fodinibius roseus]|uniref:Predicted dehydrogenase n=1 Tax=Fodinibius roseus TaxID=1194090 RepID=A0A1M4TP71_9BACT|nr:Gfo/Idh/MocA family oxidoreductase [Fodinibius roseus]SHE46261.1 Predicted dehydrogenase [Fodinibius roseus]
MKKINRRTFLKNALATSAGTLAFPAILPSSVLGKNTPNDKINIGQIGCGRIARGHDIPETLNHDVARIIAVCDVDKKRMKDGKNLVEQFYAEKKGSKNYMDVEMYEDYRKLLLNPDIDAVIISTPDHWHVQPAIEASLAGKDVYLQKPVSLTVAESQLLRDVVKEQGTILQVGTQVRSTSKQFKYAAELVRNGRIGTLHTVIVNFPADDPGPEITRMPIPRHLNFDKWLGSTPEMPYSESAVHPNDGYGRPGWLWQEQFGAGMITGWGQHQFDLAAWGMGTEYTGPTSIEAMARFYKNRPRHVHGDFMVKTQYKNGVTMYANSRSPVVIRYEGSEGWIEVFRGDYSVTKDNPATSETNRKVLNASDPKILTSEIKEDEIRLYPITNEHHGNWLDCIRSRKQPMSPIEVGHHICTLCLISHIAMKIPGRLEWDPDKERFVNNDSANSMLSRPQRHPYGTNYIDM